MCSFFNFSLCCRCDFTGVDEITASNNNNSNFFSVWLFLRRPNTKDDFCLFPMFSEYKVGLSIFGSVRFWTKINNQTNFFFFLVFEPNRTENRFKPINFGSVRFDFFPFQTGSNRTAMPRCHPLRINNVVLIVTTSCKGKNSCKTTVSIFWTLFNF